MTDSMLIPTLQGPVVTDIVLVDLIKRDEILEFETVAPPGHMLHVPLKGKVSQFIHGSRYSIKRGCAVWYNENEPILGKAAETPWRFLTINFIAPNLSPPPWEHRVVPISEEGIQLAEHMLRLWRDTESPFTLRQLRLHSKLLQLILSLLPSEAYEFRVEAETSIWWQIEAFVRSHLTEKLELKDLERVVFKTRRTINRACLAATQTTPMKRIKQIRLNHARGLVQLSNATITDIAFNVGYARTQEFCRDYKKQFEVSPTEDRKQGPDYHKP